MSRVLVDIVERHADEAAFLWDRRERASRSPLFALNALAELDKRLDANLDGLVIAQNIGLDVSLRAVERGSHAELFTAFYVAAELGDVMALARLLKVAETQQDGHRAVTSALGWLSQARADRILTELLADECPPWLHRLGIAGHAARRTDPGAGLERALSSPDAALRAQALRAVGQLGRRDLLPTLRAEARLAEEEEPWAAWSAALLGDRSALPILWKVAEGGGPTALAACDIAVRWVSPAEASARLEGLARSPGSQLVALAGAAARGDPACIPWVLDVIEAAPDLSRRAAWVYATITGAALEPPLAVRVPTVDPSDERVASSVADPYEDLPTPESGALRLNWEQVRAGFTPGDRYLGGRQIEPAWLTECLATGVQPWRESAAAELVRTSERAGLFPVHAPGRAQIAHVSRFAGRAL
jgi:uncharacterized protein (TIGR02270 family)